MPLLTELDLPEIDIFDPEFARDPHGFYRRARETGAWMAKYQFGYIPLDYEAVRFFLRADDVCRTPNRDITMMFGAQGTTFARFNDNSLMALGGKEHGRLRRILAPAFTPKQANVHRPMMREILRAILEPVVPKGECDFARVASRYPISVTCKLIGIAPEDVDQFETWLDGMGDAYGQDASLVARLDEITAGMYAYIDRVLAGRRAREDKPADLLQTLLGLAETGESLDDEELRNLLILLLGAGYDTTKNQLVLLLWLMTQHHDVWRRARDEPSFATALMEESLRFLNPIGSTHRLTNVDVEFRGVTIPANTFVTTTQAVPGRDPAVNADPERFDPDREDPGHIAFGQGHHICLGMFLARALLEEAIPILARTIQDPVLSGELRYRSPMAVWGLYELPIRFTPGTLSAVT